MCVSNMHPPERLCHLTTVPWNSSKIEWTSSKRDLQTNSQFIWSACRDDNHSHYKNKKKNNKKEEEEEVEMPKTVLRRLTFEMVHTL
jgi:hypothetical protein